jgi:hypothetical protein
MQSMCEDARGYMDSVRFENKEHGIFIIKEEDFYDKSRNNRARH